MPRRGPSARIGRVARSPPENREKPRRPMPETRSSGRRAFLRFAINAVIERAERSEYLVADRAGVGGDIVDPVMLADQLDQVAGIKLGGSDRRDIERGEIHRYSAQQWHP